MKATVCVTLKPGLLDAQGKTVKSALDALGFKGITDVRMGKYVEIELNGAKAASAKKNVERMCLKLLANPIIENYHIEVVQGSGLGVGGTHRSLSKPRTPNPEPRTRRG